MKSIIFLAACTIIALTWSYAAAESKYQEDYQLHWWDTDDNDEYNHGSKKRVPFPQCLVSGSKSRLFDSKAFQRLFDKQLQREEENLKHEGYENYKHHNEGTMYDDDNEYRHGKSESHATARAAIKLTREIMTILMCDLNNTNQANFEGVLNKFSLPKEFCSYLDKPDCTERARYRTINGICNNLKHPYQGSAQTAFGRTLDAVYEDHLSEPRRKSRRGGKLPGCREISLAMGSRPVFNRRYNNFFVIFGQMIGHDVALSVPVSDTYSRPISSCSCTDKYDWDKCTVIDIQPDDPYLRGQKCMAFPATAQAFKNQVCSLGVKEQMNANTHAADLSTLYGSSIRTSNAIRSDNGRLKSTRPQWSRYELPPGQREGKSCTDATSKRKCLTGGDSRVMINLLFTGIQSIFLRFHNQLANDLHERFPAWSSDQIYEEARRYNIAFYQRIIYEFWLPILLGENEYKKEFGDFDKTTKYHDNVPLVITNEFATAGFRLHSMVRDLFSRCNYDLKRIDELWLNDISTRVKYAYDVENNGLDSILCGSFYDCGFEFDGNFAHQIHNRLFESTNQYGNTWRNDLVAINICRGREHGLPSYNDMRENCSLPRATEFEDFYDTINTIGIKKLKRLYKSPCDVDMFVGLNMEDPIPGGLVGKTTACIISRQFKVLRDADRFHYLHEHVFTKHELEAIRKYPIRCLLCNTIHLSGIAENPFLPTDDQDNPALSCNDCEPFKIPDPKKP